MNLNRMDVVLMLIAYSDCVWLGMLVSIGLLHSQHQRHFVIAVLRYMNIRMMCLGLLVLLLRSHHLTRHQIASLVDFHGRLTIHRFSLVVLALLTFGFRSHLLWVMMLNDTAHNHLVTLLVRVDNFILYVNLNCRNERIVLDFILDYDLPAVRLQILNLVHQKVKVLHVLDESHGLLERALLDPIRHLLGVPNRLALPVSLGPVRRVDILRLVFVDLILLQKRIGILANVLELIEDDQIRVAVGADDFRERIIRKYLRREGQ